MPPALAQGEAFFFRRSLLPLRVTHAKKLFDQVQSELLEGRYQGKVIQVDSSKTGVEEEERGLRKPVGTGFWEVSSAL